MPLPNKRRSQERTILRAQVTWDAPSMLTQTSSNTTASVPGAAVGDPVILGLPAAGAAAANAGIVFSAYVSSANVVTILARNSSAGTFDPASGDYTIQIHKL